MNPTSTLADIYAKVQNLYQEDSREVRLVHKDSGEHTNPQARATQRFVEARR